MEGLNQVQARRPLRSIRPSSWSNGVRLLPGPWEAHWRQETGAAGVKPDPQETHQRLLGRQTVGPVWQHWEGSIHCREQAVPQDLKTPGAVVEL